MNHPLKTTLLGVFELAIFMPSFITRFSSDRQDAYKSFIFPAILYPLVAMAFAANQPIQPTPQIMAVHALLTWGGMFLFYNIVYVLARAVRRADYFWQTVNVLNCQAVITLLLLMPLIVPLVFAGERIGTGGLTNYWFCILLVGLAYKAYILAQGLRLNLPLGGFLAMVNLYISDISYTFLMGLSPHEVI